MLIREPGVILPSFPAQVACPALLGSVVAPGDFFEDVKHGQEPSLDPSPVSRGMKPWMVQLLRSQCAGQVF